MDERRFEHSDGVTPQVEETRVARSAQIFAGPGGEHAAPDLPQLD
jgi:hypothetical protein